VALVIVARHPATAWRVIGGEGVLLALDSKILRGLNPAGSRVWELIDGRRSTDEIAAQLVEEFDVELRQARQEVETFVDQLLAKGLVTRSS
jgi:pyrroloquinoline quinone biosynthesis protein D